MCRVHFDYTAGQRRLHRNGRLAGDNHGRFRAYHGGETALEYDGVALDTGALDDFGLSPMSALPLRWTRCARATLTARGRKNGELAAVLIPSDGLSVEVHLDKYSKTPLYAEISSAGRVRVTAQISGWNAWTQRYRYTYYRGIKTYERPAKREPGRRSALKNLRHNYMAIRAALPAGCRFLGIVKAATATARRRGAPA